MPPSPEAPDCTTPRKRPWYRLHLSTRLMLLPVAGVLAILIVPCECLENIDWHWLSPPSFDSKPQLWNGPVYKHGWPWAYAVHRDWRFGWESKIDDVPFPQWPSWTYRRAWDLSKGYEVSYWHLELDLMVAACVLGATTLLLEYRRRKRGRFFQFTLRQGLGLMLVCAVVGSLWQMLDQPYHAEQDALRTLAETATVNKTTTCIAPSLLRRLVGNRIADRGNRVSSIRILWKHGNHLPAGYLDPLGKFSHLRELIVEKSDFDRLPAALLTSQYIRAIGLQRTVVSEKCLRVVGQVSNLKQLYLANVSFPTGALKGLAPLTSLKTVVAENVSLTGSDLADLARISAFTDLFVTGTVTDIETLEPTRGTTSDVHWNFINGHIIFRAAKSHNNHLANHRLVAEGNELYYERPADLGVSNIGPLPSRP